MNNNIVHDGRTGTSLIEVSIAIAIMIIAVVMIVPTYTDARDLACEVKCVENLK